MHIIYWAHSYREEDAPVNRHFGVLIEQAERMIVNLDPPSKSVSEAKLQKNCRSSDGMVAVLTWRESGPSKYILFEIGLALRARMPVVVFIDDRLDSNILPARVLQQRFSHKTYFKQVREHTHALRILKSYMGDPPPIKYQSNYSQRTCGVVGLSAMEPQLQKKIADFIENRDYRVANLEDINIDNPLIFDQDEHLAILDVVIEYASTKSISTKYWTGAIHAASVPRILLTADPTYQFIEGVPPEFQPHVVESGKGLSVEESLTEEFNLFEQSFLSVQEPDAIERYVKMQVQAGALAGNYEASTRQLFIGAIMGDQYNVSGQTGAIGPNAHAHDIAFNQVWSQLQNKVDLPKLANELVKLRETMQRNATEPEHTFAIGAVTAAEQSARQNNGPKVVEYLKIAGKWTYGLAEKIGVDLAVEALKEAIGM